jgi:hypothetical protein
MAQTDRLEIIRELEKSRKCRIICYLTNTRPNTNFQMGADVIPRIYRHLCEIARVETSKPRIELLIHSNGGDSVVPWRLVTLIREYTSEFNVLIPNRAYSAATLVSLGADGIFMHPMGVLGPTDPTVANPFNPRDPVNQQQQLGISVEDVYSYIALIKEDLGIRGESELVQAYRTLTEQLHPLALGNVKRFYAQSRMMAKKLLALHMDEKTEHSAIQDIADNLTSKLYFHGHPINRKEAKDLGLKVKPLESLDEKLLWDLYSDFAAEMAIDEEFNFLQAFMASPQGSAAIAPQPAAQGAVLVQIDPLIGVVVESGLGSHAYKQELQVVAGRGQNGIVSGTMMTNKQGWTFAAAPAATPATGVNPANP